MGRMGWPRPRPIVFKDRSTDTQYLLSHGGEGEIVLLTPVPSLARTIPEEPLVFSPFVGNVRLFVNDGSLKAEATSLNRRDGPVFTLNYGDRRTTYEIHGDGLTSVDGFLCVRKWANLGGTTEITDLGCFLNVFDISVVVFESGVFEEGVFV